MTETGAQEAHHRRHGWSELMATVRAKDPAGLALKRSVRAAIVVSGVFGLTHVLFTNPQVSLFGAFGAFALLLLVEFPGRPRTRLVSFAGLAIVGSGFIALGTLVSTHKIAAVATMAVVGFGVLFAGIVSPQAATASTAALLVFVLPVAVVQPAAAIGPRLLGWAIAVAFCVPAAMLLWPPPWHDDLRRRLSASVSAVQRLLSSELDGRLDPDQQATVKSELSKLRDQFAGTPYPATGSVASAVALSKLVGRVEWVAGNAALLGSDSVGLTLDSVRALLRTVADTLRDCAALICDGQGHPVDKPESIHDVQAANRRLDDLIRNELDDEVSRLLDTESTGDPGASQSPDSAHDAIGSLLDPAFRARSLGIATEMMADAVLEASGAQVVGDRRLGPGPESTERSLWARLLSHLSFRSVWFRNALRGGVGLALAVAVVEITDVEHGFWVVLGTLSVLRSNALGTGATALRAIGGTAVGFLVGSAIMVGVANHTVLLWVLLPLSVLVAGVVPSVISFAAGQAGFTLVVIILFNIIDPIGWRVGLTRIEDVAIGCGVSIVVGVMFWPRGAGAALGRALSDSFAASSGYLSHAVDRLTTTSHDIDTEPSQRASHRAYMRLDDAFRQYLAERGAKRVSVETVANLFTGSNRIRLAAFTMATLPPPVASQPELQSVEVARAVLRDSYAMSHRWYEDFVEVLSDKREVLDPPPVHDRTLDSVLLKAFEDVREHRRGDRLRTTLQMLWADELLEQQGQIQADLADSATLFIRPRHRVRAE
jgi:uncharacterized membrane protein YccC